MLAFFYERFGFVEEGRFRERVRLPNGEFIDDIAMAWFPRGTVLQRLSRGEGGAG